MKDRHEVIEKQEGRGIQGNQEIICNPEVAVHPMVDPGTLGQYALGIWGVDCLVKELW